MVGTLAEELIQTNSHELVRPGPFGRAIRAGLGLATLSLLLLLLTVWRAGLWGGEVPVRDVGFWVLVCLALWGTSYVFNLAFGLSWGQKTRTGIVAGAGLADAAPVEAAPVEAAPAPPLAVGDLVPYQDEYSNELRNSCSSPQLLQRPMLTAPFGGSITQW